MVRDVKVLIIDDDEDEAEMYSIALGQLGMCVTTARSIDEGVTAFTRQSFDVVVSDITLPDGDGYDVARHVRASGARVPVIALSGWAGRSYSARARAAGFDEHFTKPLLPGELASTIARLVASTEAVRKLRDTLGEKRTRQHKLLREQREIVEHTREIIRETRRRRDELRRDRAIREAARNKGADGSDPQPE